MCPNQAPLTSLAGCVKACDKILVGNASVFVSILNCSKSNGNASWYRWLDVLEHVTRMLLM